jgi:hypothetical protein
MPLRRYDHQTHRYYDDFGRVASVTQILSASGLGGYDIYRMMQATAPDKLATAGDRGRKVHEATEQLDNGLLDREQLDPALEPYVRAYEAWLEMTGFEPLHIERIVYHERFRYAGRLDRVGWIGRGKWVVDIKTGLLLDGHANQTAAYLATLPHPLTYDRMLVQLRDDGTFHIATPEKSSYYTHLAEFLTALDQVRGQIEEKDHVHASA